MIKGSIPALITPFRDGIVDERAFQALVERQIGAGAHGLVPCGTTGESVTLSLEEHVRVVEMCVEAAAGRVPVVAGAGSNNTAHAVELARRAKAARADAVLVVAPYYNKPSPDGIVAHFKAISDAVDIDIIAYNVPSRTVVDIAPETMARLAKLEHVVGVKDASSDLGRVARHRVMCGDDFILLSGDDPSALAFNAAGGTGCISVTANIAAKEFAALQKATMQGAFDVAREIDARLAELHKVMFIEPSPAPAKYACSLLGLCTDEVRLPIIACSEPAKARIRAVMTDAGLL